MERGDGWWSMYIDKPSIEDDVKALPVNGFLNRPSMLEFVLGLLLKTRPQNLIGQAAIRSHAHNAISP
jgi:hypothetical protein